MNFKNKLVLLCLVISISLIWCSSSQKDVSKNAEDNSTKVEVSQDSNENPLDESEKEEIENPEVEETKVEIKDDKNPLKSSTSEDQKKSTTPPPNKIEQSTSQPKTATNNLNNTTTATDNKIIKNETTQPIAPKTEEKVEQQEETKKPQEVKYKGSGMGYEGSINVEVTVLEDKITKISVLSHEDTPSVALKAFDQLSNSIISSQKLNIDTVSGATYSSKGFIDAVKNALNK